MKSLKRLAPLMVAAALLVFGAALARAQAGGNFNLSWWTLDGGGFTVSNGGSFTMMGTVGQPEPGPALAGGNLTLYSGFWPAGGAAPPTCTVPLTQVGLNGPASGQANQDLTFTASYTPANSTPPINYTWSSDGLSSGQGTNTAVYHWSSAGQYQVTVSAANCGGSDDASQAVNITAPSTCTVPLAGLDLIGPASGQTGQTLTFNASPYPGDATAPINYTWSTDGLLSGQGSAQATFRWDAPGNKLVEVTARNCGGQDYASNLIVAISSACPNPISGGWIIGAGLGYTGVNYNFTASPDAAATPPFTYTWSSDGLVTGQGTPDATYSWAVTGTHALSVAIQNCGGSIVIPHSITLAEPPLTCTVPLVGVELGGAGAGQTGQNVTFTASITPANATPPFDFVWSTDGLADGQGTETAIYNWSAAGQYQVTVSAINCGGSANASRVITITAPPPVCDVPLASVSITGPASGSPGNYTFTADISPANASIPITYTWLPQPASGQGQAVAQYNWATPGVKTIHVAAENCGGSFNDAHTITISAPPSTCTVPLDSVSISGPTSGVINTSYTFDAVIAPANATAPVVYTWSPAPISGQGTAHAAYSWAAAGDQTINVTAHNCGGDRTASHQIAITSTSNYRIYLPVALRNR